MPCAEFRFHFMGCNASIGPFLHSGGSSPHSPYHPVDAFPSMQAGMGLAAQSLHARCGVWEEGHHPVQLPSMPMAARPCVCKGEFPFPTFVF